MSDLTFHLENFEGPLDLLLHLITKNKINIYDIPISQILAQYMKVLDEANTMDMEVAGDFIAMASQLVFIKSKMLLPKYTEEPEEDPRAELVEMLLEYQKFKEASEYFRSKNEIGRDIFVKSGEVLDKKEEISYSHKPSDLITAAKNMLARIDKKMPPPVTSFTGIVGREQASVGDKISEILKMFFNRTKLSFKRLFSNVKSKSDAVAMFLAILELSKDKSIIINGEDENTEIILSVDRDRAL